MKVNLLLSCNSVIPWDESRIREISSRTYSHLHESLAHQQHANLHTLCDASLHTYWHSILKIILHNLCKHESRLKHPVCGTDPHPHKYEITILNRLTWQGSKLSGNDDSGQVEDVLPSFRNLSVSQRCDQFSSQLNRSDIRHQSYRTNLQLDLGSWYPNIRTPLYLMKIIVRKYVSKQHNISILLSIVTAYMINNTMKMNIIYNDWFSLNCNEINQSSP